MCEAPVFPMLPARFPPSSIVATDAHSHQETRAVQGAISFAHKAGANVPQTSPAPSEIADATHRHWAENGAAGGTAKRRRHPFWFR